MALNTEPLELWVCDCDRTTGHHIIDALYSTCVYCKRSRWDLKEIVVPSGMGGVFSVKILGLKTKHATVKVVRNSNGFEALPPFSVPFKDIAPRWKRSPDTANWGAA